MTIKKVLKGFRFSFSCIQDQDIQNAVIRVIDTDGEIVRVSIMNSWRLIRLRPVTLQRFLLSVNQDPESMLDLRYPWFAVLVCDGWPVISNDILASLDDPINKDPDIAAHRHR